MDLNKLGEFDLIDLIAQRTPGGPGVLRGIGDDAAVLNAGNGQVCLWTVDTLLEGIHFDLAYYGPDDLGVKSLAVNVSDIAAMGGRPLYALLSLGLPSGVREDQVRLFMAGWDETARAYNVSLVGGDTVYSPQGWTVTVTVMGTCPKDRVVYRAGARVGDFIYVTGNLGSSAAGLYLLQHPAITCPEHVRLAVRQAHLRPVARVTAAVSLAESRLVTAMIDISDGLSSDVGHICTASGVGCEIYASHLPVSETVRECARYAQVDPLEWVLNGGEDYELLFTVRPDAAQEIEERLAVIGEQVSCIGRITPLGDGMRLVKGDDKTPLLPRGYDHFKGRGL
ncbi:MAG: thiamine-phosphate kinase [Peptococcaceae bacterium]|nr:thiamine-phosphate kinase [Peptococcaceae bacterium]